MAYATVEEFIGMFNARFVADLTVDGPSDEPDEVKVQQALDNASDELDGWLPRVAAAHHPSRKTLRIHACKIAIYLLSIHRPAKEVEQIRNAYTDVVRFYENLVSETASTSATPPLAGSASAPEPVFTDATLKGFV